MAIVTVAILAFIAGSFACWFLVARTPKTRWTVTALLACLAVAELMTLQGWIFTPERYSALVIGALVTVIVLISGIAAEEARPTARPFRFAPLRVRFGTLASGAYSILAVAGVMFFAFGVWAFGEPAATPASDWVLPTPAGINVVANVDQGCGGSQGSQLVCARQIDLKVPGAAPAPGGIGRAGPKARVAVRQESVQGTLAVQTVVGAMRDAYGWPFAASPAGAWHACRTVGWFLDKHTVCANVQARQGLAVVTLEVADDW